ncbi:response regulator [Pedobacter sp. P351]|uniref:response regulator n=1 Tax=Pedobacter superstes TaxID=3133441 RepID=UPI00309D822A
MIIENDPEILSIMTLILEDLNYKVIGRLKTEDIVLDLEIIKPDLVMLDNLPAGNSGSEICRKIKSDKSTRHIPVFLISAVSKLEAIARECFADGFIEKPFDLSYFEKTVISAVGT